MSDKKIKEKNENNKLDNIKKTINKKLDKFEKTVKNNVKYFLISILCFVAGMVLWVIYKDNKDTKKKAEACLYGSFFGVIVIFFIGFLSGVMQIV